MQFELPFDPEPRPVAEGEWMAVGPCRVPVRFVSNRRARRYVLRLSREGAARVTIPRGGSVAEGRRFAHKHAGWVERQLLRRAAEPARPRTWTPGTQILFRGERVRLETAMAGEGAAVQFGGELVAVANGERDLRSEVEAHLRRLAARELPERVFELARLHGLRVGRVTVRNQRSRWGSCSRRGTVSLNWRLVQAPMFVRDYIVLHELAHMKEMNHSRRFWLEVRRLCPGFKEAEAWLRKNAGLLRD